MKKIAIIGSGIGGLTAANFLARKGHHVTLFESYAMPGGYTAGFRRKGFYFESGTLSFESSALIFKTLKDIGVYDKVTFMRHSYRFKSKNYDAMPADYEEFKKFIQADFPDQKTNLNNYFKAVDRMYYVTAGLSGKANIFRKLLAGFQFAGLYRKYHNRTIPQFTEQYFPRGSAAYRALATMGYPDSSAFLIGGTLYSLFEDYWTVKEGFQALTDALVEKFKQSGGELKLNSPVDKVITRNGGAIGVLSKGAEYPADYVISACDYKTTFLNLLEPADVPQALRDKIQKAQVSEGIYVVYLGLSLSNDELLKKMKRPYVMCGEEAPGVDVHNSNDETYFERCGFAIDSLSLQNPALAPEGKSSLMMFATAPYLWRGNWGGGDRQKYEQLKNNVMETLINRADTALGGIRNAIELKDAATPLTFERYTRNTDGATSAWSWDPRKKFYPSITSVNIETPVKNLFIGSCWATQIGGVPGAISAARQCLKKIE